MKTILLALLLATAAPVAAWADAQTPRARCGELYELFFRYIDMVNQHLDGERSAAEYAKYQCDSGDTADGIRGLETILTRNLVPYPKN